MNLKTRIVKTGTLMVFLALIILLIAGGSLVYSFSTRSHSLKFVELDTNAELVEELIRTADSDQLLVQELLQYGYNLHITSKGETVFSNLEEYQQRVLEAADNAGWADQDARYLLIDGVTLVGVHMEDTVYAALHDASPSRTNYTMTESFLISYLCLGLLTILIIVLSNYRLSSRLIHRLLMPMDALTDAANRISAGDLSSPVVCEESSELESVIDAFNDMQQHLRLEREKNAAYEKARTDLVAGISHDLRTPLTAVKGYIKGLQDGIANTPDKQARYLEIAYRRACDMEALLHRLFLFSKMETGNLILEKTDVDLEDVLLQFTEDMNRELNPEQACLIFDSGEGVHPARIDLEQMTRVLSNLTENALKYVRRKPILMRLSLRREADGEHILFSDNGQGVSEETLPLLFEEFWRGDEARSSKGGEGSGLGLYIVRYIVEAHGGSVRAFNQDGLTIEMIFPDTQTQVLFL